MWTTAHESWVLHDPRFESDEVDSEHAAGPWAGHRRFAYDLLRYRAPGVLVELGTHFGVSMFAFAQAVKDGKLPVDLHAVDTWEGDPHAGLYGPEVLETFEAVRTASFSDVSITTHKMLFEEARARFADESVDMLHIDGYHSYEAAQTDYETWLPKLAPNCVVLLHDVAPDTGYGSADYWAELSQKHPSLTFVHSFGLGILFPKGTEGWDYLLGEEFERWQAHYPATWFTHLYGLQAEQQSRMIEDRDAAIRTQAAMIEDRDATIAAQAAMIDERDALIRQQAAVVEEKDRSLAAAGDEQLRLTTELVAARRVDGQVQRVVRLARRVLRKGSRVSGRLGRLTTALRLGRRVDADVRIIFDEAFYRAEYPDVASAGVDPLWHFLEVGGAEGRDPSPFFSSGFYLARNPDVAASGANPLVHYVRHGAVEGRAPSSAFDTSFYRNTYPDVADSGVNPLVHYLTVGIREGRFVGPEHRRRVMHHALAAPDGGPAAERRSVIRVAYGEPGVPVQELPLGLLEHVDVDLVTVDLWDTLVGRDRPADAAKLATARRQYLRHADARENVRSPWDLYEERVRVESQLAASTHHEEYHVVEVLEEVLRRCFPSMDERQLATEATREARAEWDDEISTTYPLREVWALLEAMRHKENPPRIAVVSDFYASSKLLLELLRAHGWPDADTPVLVSCEEQASKRLDGSLLRRAREAFGVSPERHIHIGDNRHSDYEMQLSTGGRAALLRLSHSPLPAPGALTPATVRDCYDVLRRRLRELAEFQVEFLQGEDASRRARAAGVASASLPVAVVARAIEAARERGVDRVHYMSREGAFLARVHEAIADSLWRGIGPAPEAVHLEVSRRATFGASLDAPDASNLARMWTMYGSQSLRALLVSIGADASAFLPSARRHRLTLDETISDISGDSRVQAFLRDQDVVARLTTTLEKDRSLLLDYLRSVTDVDASRWVLVDVGWRGSIQDNLAHVLPSAQLHGVYAGLFPFLNPQPPNCTKEAVGFDGNQGEEYSFAEPPAAVERPWTPHLPSTIGYTRQANGTVAVEHAQETQASALIDDFQDGVISAAPLVAEFFATFGLTVPMVRDEVRRDLRDYYERPYGGTADIWFGSEHDDTFGALNITPFGKDVPDAAWLAEGGEARYAAAAMRSKWEPGFAEWLPVLALRELRRMLEENR